jgi:hypothetical protein
VSYEWVLIVSIPLIIREKLTIEALFVSYAAYICGKDVLHDDTSSPWHDGYQVLGQVENGVAEVSSFKYRISWRRNTTYMLTSKTYSSVHDTQGETRDLHASTAQTLGSRCSQLHSG